MANNRIKATVLWAALFGTALASASAATAGKPPPPPPPPVADPLLVYLNGSGAIEVANLDGKANTVVGGKVPAKRPTWGPTFGHPNAGSSAADPWYIYYEYDYCNELRRFPLWKTGTGGLATGPEETVNKTLPVGATCASTLDPSPIAQEMIFTTGYVDAGFLSSIRSLDVSGSGPTFADTQLLQVLSPEYSMTWTTVSGDGQQIAFAMDRQSDDADSIQIATYREEFLPHWKITKILTPFGAIGPRYMEWSPVPGSKDLAYSDGTGIHIINIETGVIQNLGLGSQPTWFPDGTRLYFSGGRGLAYMTLSDRAVTTITGRGPNHSKYRN